MDLALLGLLAPKVDSIAKPAIRAIDGVDGEAVEHAHDFAGNFAAFCEPDQHEPAEQTAPILAVLTQAVLPNQAATPRLPEPAEVMEQGPGKVAGALPEQVEIAALTGLQEKALNRSVEPINAAVTLPQSNRVSAKGTQTAEKHVTDQSRITTFPVQPPVDPSILPSPLGPVQATTAHDAQPQLTGAEVTTGKTRSETPPDARSDVVGAKLNPEDPQEKFKKERMEARNAPVTPDIQATLLQPSQKPLVFTPVAATPFPLGTDEVRPEPERPVVASHGPQSREPLSPPDQWTAPPKAPLERQHMQMGATPPLDPKAPEDTMSREPKGRRDAVLAPAAPPVPPATAPPLLTVEPLSATVHAAAPDMAAIEKPVFDAVQIERAAPLPPDAAQLSRTETARYVAAQIADVIKSGSSGPLEVTLRPEELGRLSLSFSRDGSAMQVMLTAERPETLDLVRRNIELLEQDLRDLGYASLTFAFGDRGRDQAQRDSPAQTAQIHQSEPLGPAEIPVATIHNTHATPGGMDLRL